MEKERKIIHFANFLFSLAIGLALYINSSFLSGFVGEKLVGIVYALGSLASITGILVAPLIFKRLKAYKFLLWITFIDALTFLGLSFIQNQLAIILVFILGFTLNTLVVFTLDEILKIFSRNKNTGKIRGVYLTLGNLALIISQLSITKFMNDFSFRKIYFVGFIIMFLFFLISLFTLRGMPEPKYDKLKTIGFVKNFFRNIRLRRAYTLSFLVQFFYSWMLIYTPIYLLRHLNFSLGEVSAIFMFMLLPFLFMPIYTGKLADKIGERTLLMFAFSVATLSTILLYISNAKVLILWAILLFFTRVGISTAETMSDTYFFKHIHAENEEFVSVYRSTSPLANLLGPLLAVLFLTFLPAFNFIYLLLGLFMLYGIYTASQIGKKEI
jgi:MFS family permease